MLDTTPYHGITLYSHPYDHYSHSVRFVLAEKQIVYKLIIVEDFDEDLSQLNPYNSLPTLIDSHTKLFKTSIINEYIDSRYRQLRLYADTPAEKAEQQQYLWRIEQDWFKLADILLRHPDSFDAQQYDQAIQELQDILVNLDRLFLNYPYFISQQFSILDCTLAPMLLRIFDLLVNLNPSRNKGVWTYCQRIFGRESFKKSLTVFEQTRYTNTLQRLNIE